MDVIIAPRAREDIDGILTWTEENFGPQILRRYAKLVATAIEEVAANPELAGSCQRPEIADHCRTYHLFFSRKSAARAGDRIRRPRHFLLYRVTESGIVEIGRVLHDSMELKIHLPEEYQRSSEPDAKQSDFVLLRAVGCEALQMMAHDHAPTARRSISLCSCSTWGVTILVCSFVRRNWDKRAFHGAGRAPGGPAGRSGCRCSAPTSAASASWPTRQIVCLQLESVRVRAATAVGGGDCRLLVGPLLPRARTRHLGL